MKKIIKCFFNIFIIMTVIAISAGCGAKQLSTKGNRKIKIIDTQSTKSADWEAGYSDKKTDAELMSELSKEETDTDNNVSVNDTNWVSADNKTYEETTEYSTEEIQSAVKYCYLTVDANEAGGVIFSGQLSFEDSVTVYSLLCATGVSIEGSGYYVQGINGIKEKDHGPQSGWTYTVNGEMVMKSCGSCYPNDGDTVCWQYINYEY